MNNRSPTLQSLANLGDSTLKVFDDFGRFCLFVAAAVAHVPGEFMSRRGWGRFLPQCYTVGANSVLVVMLTGTFVGMVLIVQSFESFDAAGLRDRLGALVNATLCAELGPVLAGVMLAGRIGGALTAELGTMNITEQLLAYRSMGADPMRHLVVPRVMACLLLTPLLTCYAILMGALGAWGVYVGLWQAESHAYWESTRQVMELWDIGAGLVKSMFFGGAIGFISCYKGFNCSGGAEGVARGCTQAFVVSFIVILVLDFFLNIVINGLYRALYGFRVIL
jgi:phospholipid/cholesterol/gamma-HCH transport system permease protein